MYALGNNFTKGNNQSVLLLLQLSTGDLIEAYTLKDSSFHYLNDLAVSNNNEIFITDSESNKVYTIQRPSKTLEIYLDSEDIAHSNGITISSNDAYLYVASRKGIRIIEIKTKKVINEPNDNYRGIDGLKFYENNLYGIVNGYAEESPKNGLFKYELNNASTEILDNKKLIKFTEKFIIPTTFDIFDKHIYFVINTQLDNFNEDTKKAINLNTLQPYQLMKTGMEF